MALTQDDLTAKMNAPVENGPRMFTLHEQGQIGMELRALRDVVGDLNRLIEEQRDDLRACGKKVDRLLRQVDDLQQANDKLREELRHRAH